MLNSKCNIFISNLYELCKKWKNGREEGLKAVEAVITQNYQKRMELWGE